jgi:hypothetical protein
MKALKIILGIFCFALTINAFKDGLEPGESFVYYLPITLVFVIGILLFKSALKSKDE